MNTIIIGSRFGFVALAAALALAACGKDDKAAAGAAGSCGALEVTVDGKAIEGLSHGLALTHQKGDELTQEVDVFNHDGVTCAELLSKTGRQITNKDEVNVKAFTGGGFGNGAAIESHTALQLDVALIGKAPAKAGDQVTLCLKKATFTPKVGAFKDKQVTMAGSFQGTYCGVMAW